MNGDEETVEGGKLLHLHLSDDEARMDFGQLTLADGSKKDVIWKDVLKVGTYPMSPGKGGAVDKPMTVTRDGESSYADRRISMSDVIEAHKDGAFKYVTIPTKHSDGVLDNTGYVPSPEGVIKAADTEDAVKIEERDGETVLRTALAFTEPDVEGKVKRATIPDCSGGFFFGHVNKAKRKKFRCAMKHVCLTNVPFMGNLNPFKAAFSDDPDIPDDVEVEFYEFAEGDAGSSESGSEGTAEIVWEERFAVRSIQRDLQNTLSPPEEPQAEGQPYVPKPSYYVQDISIQDGNYAALVEEYYKGDTTRYVIPFKRTESGVEVAPSTRWTEAREAMVAASDTDFEDMSSDKVLEKLRANLSDTLGDEHYKVEAISLDQRAHVTHTGTSAEWIVPFFTDGQGGVQAAPPADWKRTKAATSQSVEQDKEEAKQSVSTDPKVTLSDEPRFDTSTPEGRVKAARYKRQKAFS